jgi:dihydropteroate synthase
MFDWGSRTFVMGILNATPDSFSGDGLLSQRDAVQAAVAQAESFLDAGADILDIGGESTRPGAPPVDAEEEISRVLPILRALVDAFPQAVFSIDTSKAEVANLALEAGARIVNDVWGLRADAKMAETVARHDAYLVLMHNRSQPARAEIREKLGGRYVGMTYEDLLEDVRRELMESVALAHEAEIPDEHLLLDPGIGFGKTVEQNLRLLNHLDEIKSLGYPVLVGPSRKSFIGYTLDLPPEERLEGTAAAVAIAIARGADVIRVHDVREMTRVARMTDAILRA